MDDAHVVRFEQEEEVTVVDAIIAEMQKCVESGNIGASPRPKRNDVDIRHTTPACRSFEVHYIAHRFSVQGLG